MSDEAKLFAGEATGSAGGSGIDNEALSRVLRAAGIDEDTLAEAIAENLGRRMSLAGNSPLSRDALEEIRVTNARLAEERSGLIGVLAARGSRCPLGKGELEKLNVQSLRGLAASYGTAAPVNSEAYAKSPSFADFGYGPKGRDGK